MIRGENLCGGIIDGCLNCQILSIIGDSLVDVGIVKSWGCVVDLKKKVGNAIMVAWFLIGKMRENMKDFPVGVGTAST